MTKLPVATLLPLPFEYKTVPLDSISSSLTNPRKYFDQTKLEELAASIAANGILQAPTVRPARAAGQVVPGAWTLIFGERRTKAARLVKGLKEIEVKVIDCDDLKAAELQLIENDAREDLSPLERAEGYQQLMKAHGLSAEQVAERVGRKRSWVYEMVGLLKLHPVVKKALDAEGLERSCAVLMEVLSQEAQPGVLEVALYGGPDGDALSYRALREWIKAEFMLDLADAPFDTKDGTLPGGACTNCPKRTGFAGQSDMFAEQGKKTDLCKDKPCFDRKEEETLKRVVKKAKDSGEDVLSQAESRAALKTGYAAEYVRLDEGHRHALGEGKTWGQALKGTKLEPSVAVTPEGELVKVAKKEDVKAALAQKGSKLASSPALMLESDEVAASPYNKPDPKRELREKVTQSAVLLMTHAIEKNGLPRELLVLLAQHLMATCGTIEPVNRRGWDHLTSKARADRLKHEPERRLEGIIFDFAFADAFVETAGDCDEFRAAAKALGVDLKKLEKEVAAEEELKAKAAAAVNPKAKPEVEKVPTAQLAAEAKTAKKKRPKKAAAKKKKAAKRGR